MSVSTAHDRPAAADPAVTGFLEVLDQADKGARDALKAAGESIEARFMQGEPVVKLVRARALVVDQLLTMLWREHAPSCVDSAALIAVGGYGRGELHPCSDIDILVLLSGPASATATGELSAFLTSLWDVGLEIGHSVRTVDECFEQAAHDLTVATTLMEARRLDGPGAAL